MEFLKGVLTDELYAQLETALKDNKDIKLGNLAKGDYVGKDKFDAQAEQLKAIKAQNDEANKQIEAFKGMDIEGAKKAADDWKAKAEKTEADFNAKLSQMALDTALEKRLIADRAKDPIAVRAHLKLDQIKLDGENLLGYDDQIKALKESESTAYHFSTDKEKPNFQGQANGGNNGGGTPGLQFNFQGVRQKPETK